MNILRCASIALLAAFSLTAAAASDTRIVEHASGTTEISGTPTRVVALEFRYVEHLLALGVVPVGIVDPARYETLIGLEVDKLSETANVGTPQEPSLEAIAALRPDLIIGVRFRHEPIYDRLSAIAPTLLFHYTDLHRDGPRQLDYMREELRSLARAVGRPAAADAALGRLDEALAEAAATIAERGLAGDRFAFAQFLAGTAGLRMFTDHSIAVQLLERIGFENAWDGRFERFGFNTVTAEALRRIGDARLVYIVVGNSEGFDRLSASPVWARLPFVHAGRAHRMPTDTWPFGGPLSAIDFIGKAVDAMTGGG